MLAQRANDGPRLDVQTMMTALHSDHRLIGLRVVYRAACCCSAGPRRAADRSARSAGSNPQRLGRIGQRRQSISSEFYDRRRRPLRRARPCLRRLPRQRFAFGICSRGSTGGDSLHCPAAFIFDAGVEARRNSIASQRDGNPGRSDADQRGVYDWFANHRRTALVRRRDAESSMSWTPSRVGCRKPTASCTRAARNMTFSSSWTACR